MQTFTPMKRLLTDSFDAAVLASHFDLMLHFNYRVDDSRRDGLEIEMDTITVIFKL